MAIRPFLWTTLLLAGVVLAQDKPADMPPGMEHMQHEHGGFMQGGMHHAIAKGVKLQANVDAATHTVTVRVGPMNLPANTDHRNMPQPPAMYWPVPINGWFLSYTPKMLDANGNAAPGILLHHTAFWNENRPDFLCPNKDEHIFGAGSELTKWVQVPGYGYRVQKGDKIRIETMVYNPTPTSYENVYLQVTIPYQEASADANAAPALKSYYPAWMDVKVCGSSGYDLKPGKNVETGVVETKYAGELLGVGGHMHNYAKQLALEDVSRKETVATLDAKTDEQGHLLSMSAALFLDTGGFKLAADDALKIIATYDNTSGKLLRDGAMGIVVGYFVPADDKALAALRRPPKRLMHEMAGMSHDQ